MPDLRAATPDDAPTLAALIRAAFEEQRGLLDPPSGAHAQTPDDLLARLSRGGAFVMEETGRALGCVFWEARPDHLYWGRLSVAPEARGRGLSRPLIEAAETRALELHLPLARLNVRVALPENRAYYARLGYTHHAYGTHPGYATPTYEVMERRLR